MGPCSPFPSWQRGTHFGFSWNCTFTLGFILVMVFSTSVTEKVATYIFLFLQEEDDWKEFEQKEEIDYSGLRVQSMQISEKEDDESEKREEPGDSWEETGGGGGGGGIDRSSGPWNKSAPAPAPVVEPIVTETPEPVQTGGVYRPPGAREGGRPRRAQQGPPEIYSDTQFPSLQSTAKLVDSRKY
ncbi:protein CDV3 homolog isoform X2 [Parus major]|uniref:protein CDV3 homolog isoform X2 n=2 Tax=Parus major TaxID=9157 RepID=UPI001087A0A7|nr:protein CDV3 homolog isoform X2 [Parus major]